MCDCGRLVWLSYSAIFEHLCRKGFILEEHTLTMCLSVFDKVLCSCSSAIDSAKESASYVVMSFKTLSVEFELCTFCSRNFLLRFPCLSDFSSAIPRDLLESLLSCMWDTGHEWSTIQVGLLSKGRDGLRVPRIDQLMKAPLTSRVETP